MKQLLQISSLIVLDLVGYAISLFISWFGRLKVYPLFLPNLPEFHFTFGYFLNLFWIPAIFLFFNAYEGLYTLRLPFWDETKKLLKALTISAVSVLAIVSLGKISHKVSRIVLVNLWFVSLFIFPFVRLWGKKLLYAIGVCRERVLILGAGQSGKLVLNWLKRERHIGYDVIGFLDDDDEKTGTYIDGKKVFGKTKNFGRFVKDLGIQTIIIAMPSLGPEKLSQWAARVQKYVKHTLIVPDLYGISLLNTELIHLFYEEIFLLNIKNNLQSLTNRIAKRSFDILLAILCIPVLIPLIGIIGFLIKRESPGPVFYTHPRIGRNGKTFMCYKFRTMVQDAEDELKRLLETDHVAKNEWEMFWKITDDPRVTRIGRFLRTTSLDELPQIFNVLKGEMSMIGPRPYLLREYQAIKDKIEIITSVRPGITGLWQVSGRNETTYLNRIRLDIWYIMNWSLWLDLFILLKTIKVVLGREGVK